eukprot:3381569-Prymnesium_polylepis.1
MHCRVRRAVARALGEPCGLGLGRARVLEARLEHRAEDHVRPLGPREHREAALGQLERVHLHRAVVRARDEHVHPDRCDRLRGLGAQPRVPCLDLPVDIQPNGSAGGRWRPKVQ